MEFEGAKGHDLRAKSLEDHRAGIRLMNVRTTGEGDDRVQFATVYVPKNKSGHFLKKIQDYKDKETSSNPERAKPKNQQLVASVDDVREALLKAFWTDEPEKMPQEEPRWVEVWLAVEPDETLSKRSLEQFRDAAAKLDILSGNSTHILKFPERWVLLLHANQAQLLALLDNADKIAEFRAARETCSYFVNEAENKEQAEWSTLR